MKTTNLLLFFFFFIFSLNSINRYSIYINDQIIIPELNYITIENNKIIISWDSIKKNTMINNLNLYRNTDCGDWVLIKKIYDLKTLSYTDSMIDVNKGSIKYKISVNDICGNERSNDLIKKTIFLKVKRNLKNKKDTLFWSNSNFNILSYTIYRIVKIDTFVVLNKLKEKDSIYINNDINNEFDAIHYLIKENIILKNNNIINISSNVGSENIFDTILNNTAESTLKICPNPLANQSKIYFTFIPIEKYKLKIYDIIGNIVYERTIDSNNNIIYRNDFKKGIYLLYVLKLNNNNQYFTTKLIVE